MMNDSIAEGKIFHARTIIYSRSRIERHRSINTTVKHYNSRRRYKLSRIFILRTLMWTILSKSSLYEYNYNKRNLFGYMRCLTFQASGCSPRLLCLCACGCVTLLTDSSKWVNSAAYYDIGRCRSIPPVHLYN